MPRNYRLTPIKSQRRWMKKYKGRRFTYGFGKDGTQESSYPAALAAYEAWQAKVDAEQVPVEPSEALVSERIRHQYEAQIMAAEYVVQWHRENGREADAINGEIEIDKIKRQLAAGSVLDLTFRHQTESWLAPVHDSTPPDLTIASNVKAFLAHKRAVVSSGRTDVCRICLNHLMDFAGEGAGINKLDGVLLSDYHQKLAGMVKRREIGGSTAKDRLDTVKQFIRWLWGRDQIALPKNIDILGIKQTTKVIETITDDQVTAILNAAGERTRLYILLALNCGFTQVDIGGLRQDQVDWKTGRIIYKRSKTRLHADVPTVDYRLWPETNKLLKQHRSEGSELALLNEDGQPLWQEGERDGKYYKNDNVRSAIERVLKVVKDKYPFKLFRKTAASKLGENAEHARFVQHFLGHSPRTVADKYYVKPSRPQFDAAVKWLGEQFGY